MGAIGLKYVFLFTFLHIQVSTAIITRWFFFYSSMEIWYVLIFLRLTVPRCVLMRSPRFWKVGRMFPRWSELDAFDRFHHTVYQRISSLDLVRAKPHKNTKLIFTVIIRCLVLLCWTLSHFSNTFPTKGTQLDTTTLIIWKNIDTRERERDQRTFFFALCCYTVK